MTGGGRGFARDDVYHQPPITTMSIADTLLPEFDQEMTTTRRLLERVPSDNGPWKPHEKSFSLGHLAQLVSRMPGWITLAMRETKLDLSGAPSYGYEPTESLVQGFDRNVKEARGALADARDQDSMVPRSLTLGERCLFTLPRVA